MNIIFDKWPAYCSYVEGPVYLMEHQDGSQVCSGCNEVVKEGGE